EAARRQGLRAERGAAALGAADPRRGRRQLPPRDRERVHADDRGAGALLRVDGLDRARAAALLPAAGPGLRVRVRQRAEQRQSRALGLAEPELGLRRDPARAPLPDVASLIAR